jgi:assimilatory nitrate reductase catalytic subunit
VQGRDFVRYELAGRNSISDHSAWARALLGVSDPDADWLEYEDLSDGSYRAVHVVDDRIDMCLFMSARPDLPSRSWLAGLFAKEKLEEADRVGLLVGSRSRKAPTPGRRSARALAWAATPSATPSARRA